MELTFAVEQLDAQRLLEQWRWLVSEAVTLVARNAFGDLFLRTVEGKVVWLDVGAGTLVEVADSEQEFRQGLEDPHRRSLWLAEADVESWLVRKGVEPDDSQCIGFKIPPVFAESASVSDNAYVADLYEHVSFLGDLHRQLADTPDGTRVKLQLY